MSTRSRKRGAGWSQDDLASVESWRDALKSKGLEELGEFLDKNPYEKEEAKQLFKRIEAEQSFFPKKFTSRNFRVALIGVGRDFVDALAMALPCGACGELVDLHCVCLNTRVRGGVRTSLLCMLVSRGLGADVGHRVTELRPPSPSLSALGVAGSASLLRSIIPLNPSASIETDIRNPNF